MASERFPGKVLAPFHGEPIILHVLRRVEQVLERAGQVVVVTSTEASDEPLVAYLDWLGVPAYRGPLHDVFERFRLAAQEFPCDWILRLSADSPVLDARVLATVIGSAAAHCDLVTTIFPRTLPKGQNAELIRVPTFLTIDPADLTAEDREHGTGLYYRHPERFRIVSVTCSDSAEVSSFAVDTVDDLKRLEQLTVSGRRLPSYRGLSARPA